MPTSDQVSYLWFCRCGASSHISSMRCYSCGRPRDLGEK